MFVRWALHNGTRDFCPDLAALVDPVKNIFFFTHCTLLYFNSFEPIAQQAGQAVVQGRLSPNVYLWIGWYTRVKLAMYWS